MAKQNISRTIKFIKNDLELFAEDVRNSIKKPNARIGADSPKMNNLLDQKLYRMLETALSGSDTSYADNPKKACMITAILLIKADEVLVSTGLSDTTGALQLPTDDEKTDLVELLKLLKATAYDDAELFGRQVTSDMTLRSIRQQINILFMDVPLFRAAYQRVLKLCQEASHASAVLSRGVREEIEREDEATKYELEDLADRINMLEQCETGDKPVVYMESITYPDATSEYVCGNCGEHNPASGLLIAKRKASSSKELEAAMHTATAQFADRPITSNTRIKMLAAHLGVVKPTVCDCCGAVNVVSDEFTLYFKHGVYTRWIHNCDNSGKTSIPHTFSAEIVEKTIETISNDYAGNDEDKRIDPTSILPVVLYKREEKEVEVNLTDLFSSETYTAYLTGVKIKDSESVLQSDEERVNLFLRYMISLLHSVAVGSTPKDIVYTILNSPLFTELASRFKELADIYDHSKKQLAALQILQKAYSSGRVGRPLAGYEDCFFFQKDLDDLVDIVEDDKVKEAIRNRSNGHVALLESNIKLIQETVEKTLQELNKVCAEIRTQLLSTEKQLYSQQNITAPEELSLHDLESPDDISFIIRNGELDDDKLYSNGVGALLWSYVLDFYKPLLMQTLLSKYSALLQNHVIFRGVFAQHDEGKIQKAAKKLYADLTDELPSVQLNSNYVIFRELLIACTEASRRKLSVCLRIDDAVLLKQHVDSLPSLTDGERIIYTKTLDMTGFYKLSTFSSGIGIDGYKERLMMSLDADESITEYEVLARAQAAADAYCILSPFDDIENIQQELKEFIDGRQPAEI